MITYQQWFERDPAKKDIEWAQGIVTYLRIYMQFVVNPERAYENMRWLLGVYDTEFLKKMFKHAERANVDFSPMAILERTRNVIISDIQDAGVHVELKAIDPTAVNQRKEDRNLLANRRQVEAIVSAMRGQINLPPYSLEDEKANGKNVFNGNAEDFDGMGLDDSNDEDLDYFFKSHFRLLEEMYGEDAINYFFEYNNVQEMLALWTDDMLAKRAVAMQQYISEVNGAPTVKYVAPETVKAFMGNSRDFSDAQAIGLERKMSVSEFIQMVGDEFDFERDWHDLIIAVNLNNNTQFTGVNTDGYRYFGHSTNNICNWDQFVQYKIAVGYVEWRSIDGTTFKINKNNGHGNVMAWKKQFGTTDSPNSIYKRESYYSEVIYKAYYLMSSNTTQKLYKYGKLAWQQVEGTYDEYSNFSISVYKDVGKTVSEIARKYMRLIEKSYVKFEHMVEKALPPGFDYNYDSLMEIAKRWIGTTNSRNAVDEVLNFMENSSNKIHVSTRRDGTPISGGGMVNQPLANGLSAAVVQFLDVCDRLLARMESEIGLPGRGIYNPQPRDVAKLQMAALEYSNKATAYIPRAIMVMLDNGAKRMVLSLQDIIQFKDKNSLPYKFLINALGDKAMENIEALGKIAMHRYGIFVHSYNSYQDKLKMNAIADQAYINKEISPEQYFLILSISNPKKAALVLSYEKRRNERKQQEALQQQAQIEMQKQQQINEAKMQQIQVQGQMELQKVNLQGEWDYKVAELQVTGDIHKTQQKIDAKPQEIDTKANSNIRQQQAKADIDQQKSIME